MKGRTLYLHLTSIVSEEKQRKSGKNSRRRPLRLEGWGWHERRDECRDLVHQDGHQRRGWTLVYVLGNKSEQFSSPRVGYPVEAVKKGPEVEQSEL